MTPSWKPGDTLLPGMVQRRMEALEDEIITPNWPSNFHLPLPSFVGKKARLSRSRIRIYKNMPKFIFVP